MSVPELSHRAGISTVAIYNIENGVSINPREETRKKLAKALNVETPIEVVEEAKELQYIEGLGTLVDFDPYSNEDRPSEGGVYVLYDISERPVYIGKAANIGIRISQHVEKFWFKQPIVSSASYIAISDEKLRHQIEQIMIKFLKSNAVINRQSVDR
jgi:transcriptional regulator with XRE-family HTH domain